MKKYSYVSLFSSAGIGCYGFKQEGFDCVVTNELIERRLQIQKNNKKCIRKSGYISGDITLQETKGKILFEVNEYKKKFVDIDFLCATPPCQGISLANHKKTESDKRRNSLVLESILLTKEITPRVFIFENVRNFLKTICTDEDGTDKCIDEAIYTHLSRNYIINSQLLNFKNYGVPSSRTRTLVVGVRRDMYNIHPIKLFPVRSEVASLKKTIGHLKSLSEMGGYDPDDFLHNYKRFDPKMLPWIELITEGQSAFDNTDPKRKPHSIKDNILIPNANKNADKYKRQIWDKVAPCIHTRNDTFSSQNTIHPCDNRVFSIRELMLMMSVPKSFQWWDVPFSKLNKLQDKEKKRLLEVNEMNIRQSLGEAVPTNIFKQIAKNYKNLTNSHFKSNYSVESLDQIYRILIKIIPSGSKNKSLRLKIDSKETDFTSYVIDHLNLLDYSKIELFIKDKNGKNLGFNLPSHICLVKSMTQSDFIISNDSLDLLEDISTACKEFIFFSKNTASFPPNVRVKEFFSIDRMNLNGYILKSNSQLELF